MNKLIQSARIKDALALFAGASMPMAFAPFHYYFITMIAFAVYLFSLLNTTPRQGAWRGLLFGVGLFGVGVSWVYVSIHEFGNTVMPLAIFITAVFVLILAIFPMIPANTVTSCCLAAAFN